MPRIPLCPVHVDWHRNSARLSRTRPPCGGGSLFGSPAWNLPRRSLVVQCRQPRTPVAPLQGDYSPELPINSGSFAMFVATRRALSTVIRCELALAGCHRRRGSSMPLAFTTFQPRACELALQGDGKRRAGEASWVILPAAGLPASGNYQAHRARSLRRYRSSFRQQRAGDVHRRR